MKQWYYVQNDKQAGPVDESVLVEMLQAGTLSPHTYVWSDGMTEWVSAKDDESLAAQAFTSSSAQDTLTAGTVSDSVRPEAKRAFVQDAKATISGFGWYLDALKQYAVFRGRARRKAYWMFFLFDTLFTIVATVSDAILFGTTAEDQGPIWLVYTLATIIPYIALTVRRMHDNGRSGWWMLVPIMNIVYLFTDSQPGDNAYGPNPKGL